MWKRAEFNSGGRSLFLAAAYLLSVVLAVALFLAFAYRTPASIDKAIAIITRAYFYRLGFAEIDQARNELRQGQLDLVEERLTRFLDKNPAVQRSQLRTHPMVVSREMLAVVQHQQGKLGRAQETLEALTQTVPLNYRAWYLRGKAQQAAGDLEGASTSLDRSFRLSLINTEVIETYLSVLQELGDFESALWVEDQFSRARQRAAPTATVSLGQRRPDWQRKLLSRAGIPIEHARFFRTFSVRGLNRGASQALPFPGDVFQDWPPWAGRPTVQVRFEHIFDGLRLEEVRYRSAGADQNWRVDRLEQDRIQYLHHPYSSADFAAEFELDLDPAEIGDLEIQFSCPELALSDQAQGILAKARANASAIEVDR